MKTESNINGDRKYRSPRTSSKRVIGDPAEPLMEDLVAGMPVEDGSSVGAGPTNTSDATTDREAEPKLEAEPEPAAANEAVPEAAPPSAVKVVGSAASEYPGVPAIVPSAMVVARAAVGLDRAREGETFATICADIRVRVGDLEGSIVQQSFAIADRFVAAKKRYEEETRTGHGKRNPSGVTPFVKAAGDAIGKSESFVQRFLTIAALDPKSRGLLVSAKEAPSNATLLAVARESDLEKRAEAIASIANGNELNPIAARAKTDRAFAAVLKSLMDPKLLGGVADHMPVPNDLGEQYPELRAYANLGAIRATIKDAGAKRMDDKARKLAREHERLGTRQVVVRAKLKGEAERAEAAGKRVWVQVLEIRVPRAVLEKALADTADNGDVFENGTLVSSSPDKKVRHENVDLTDARVTIRVA